MKYLQLVSCITPGLNLPWLKLTVTLSVKLTCKLQLWLNDYNYQNIVDIQFSRYSLVHYSNKWPKIRLTYETNLNPLACIHMPTVLC